MHDPLHASYFPINDIRLFTNQFKCLRQAVVEVVITVLYSSGSNFGHTVTQSKLVS